jgi:hypothetical protein
MSSSPHFQLRLVRLPNDTTTAVDEITDADGRKSEVLKAVLLDESAIDWAAYDPSPANIGPSPVSVNVFFTAAGREKYAGVPGNNQALAIIDGQVLHAWRDDSDTARGHCVLQLPGPGARADAEKLVAKLNALAGKAAMPPKIFHSPAEVLAGLGAEARPDPAEGWDEFTHPKADKWMDENVSARGFQIELEATVKSADVQRISPKGRLDQTLRWDVKLLLDEIPFELDGQKAMLKLNSYDPIDPNATTFTLYEPRSVVTVSGDEAFARWAKTLKAGDKLSIHGTISKAVTWPNLNKLPPEMWILLSDPSVVRPPG